MEDGRIRWFGASWAAPICEPGLLVPTPIGAKCFGCQELINARDQGFLVASFGMDQQENVPKDRVAYHRECFLLSIIGKTGWFLKK